MKKIFFILGGLLLLVLPITIYASEASFYLATDEEYNANIYWAGDSLEINGRVNGDVFVFGNQVVINGQVKGDVIALVSDAVVIGGTVDGNVRAISGGEIKVNGEVKRAVSILAPQIYINDQAKIGATALILGREVEMRGQIAGNLDGAAESLFISGQLTHANIEVGDLVVSPTAEVRGNLNYQSVSSADIQDGATISGFTNWQEEKTNTEHRYDGSFFLGVLLRFLGVLVVGLIILAFAKKPSDLIVSKLGGDFWKAVLWGLLFFVLAPLAVIILLFSVIGIPLAILLSVAYALICYLAKVYVAQFVGQWLAKKLKWNLDWPLAFLLGLVVYFILANLPFIGGVIVMLTIWWGMGGILQAKKEYFHLSKKIE